MSDRIIFTGENLLKTLLPLQFSIEYSKNAGTKITLLYFAAKARNNVRANYRNQSCQHLPG